MITRRTIVDILKNNITETRNGISVIYPEDFDKIAEDIMTELHNALRPKRECLSELSRYGKHTPTVSDDGTYCSICGMDLY